MMGCTNSLNKGPIGTSSSTTTIPTSQVMKIIQFRTCLAKECVLYIPWSGLRQRGGVTGRHPVIGTGCRVWRDVPQESLKNKALWCSVVQTRGKIALLTYSIPHFGAIGYGLAIKKIPQCDKLN